MLSILRERQAPDPIGRDSRDSDTPRRRRPTTDHPLVVGSISARARRSRRRRSGRAEFLRCRAQTHHHVANSRHQSSPLHYYRESVRVVAGELRGRRIESPEGNTTRPTTDMAREAIFNSLGSHYDLAGARIVDCFAGTGALGIEAISRGAGHVTFIERDKRALDTLKHNIDSLGITDRSTIVRGDALTQVAQCKDATLVLADPPYDFAKWAEFLAAVPCNLVVAESGAPVAAPDGWEVLREKRYGRTHVTFLRRLP